MGCGGDVVGACFTCSGPFGGVAPGTGVEVDATTGGVTVGELLSVHGLVPGGSIGGTYGGVVGVAVGGAGVFFGGIGVLVGGTGVFVGGTGVLVGGVGELRSVSDALSYQTS